MSMLALASSSTFTDNLTGWGTTSLAVVTAITLGVTVWLAVTDRRRNDRQRKEDRDRDDRLRREAAEEAERRERTERRASADFEARQVHVMIEAKPHPKYPTDFTHKITVSTPRAYPIKQVDGHLVRWSSGQMAARPFGFRPDDPYVDQHRVYFGFWSQTPDANETPLIRFVDWHGNLYYQYRHYTAQFPQNTDWLTAAQKIDEWIRRGPEPDSPS